ncbi:radical SAM protein [Paraburkholderia sp. MM6662-R1]|uniref:radical SAM protein n=1 Tax=Paraburkholderia sp. MM6662-R1 TaxID=2991066 RepID=UPI003D204687
MLRQSAYPEVVPEIHSLYLLLTNRCNLTCKHCCVWSSPKGHHGLRREEAQEILNDVVRLYGPIRLVLGGGEPLMRPGDALAILRHSTDLGMQSLLLTNAMLINDGIGRNLAGIEGLRIRVSVDGTTRERHDFIRGIGSFERTVSGIKRLVDFGYDSRKLEVGCTIYPGWEDEMENILRFCDELGITIIKLKALSKLGRATEFWTNIPTTKPDEDTQLYRNKLHSGIYERHKGQWKIEELNDISFGELNVYYDGNVYAYSFMGDEDRRNAYLGNLLDMPLEEVMNRTAISRSLVTKFLKYASGPARSLKCLNITRL